MEFNLEDFVQIQKSTGHGGVLNTFRINSAQMMLSPDLMEKYSRGDGTDTAMVILQYNSEQKAIRLAKTDNTKEGFVFARNAKNSGKSGYSAVPAMIKKMRIPRGDYVAVGEEHPDIYVYSEDPEMAAALNPQEPKHKYRVEDSNIEEGDIVSWAWEKREDNRRVLCVITGLVMSVQEDREELVATIEPFSQVYKDHFPTRFKVEVPCSKLVIREKHNV